MERKNWSRDGLCGCVHVSMHAKSEDCMLMDGSLTLESSCECSACVHATPACVSICWCWNGLKSHELDGVYDLDAKHHAVTAWRSMKIDMRDAYLWTVSKKYRP